MACIMGANRGTVKTKLLPVKREEKRVQKAKPTEKTALVRGEENPTREDNKHARWANKWGKEKKRTVEKGAEGILKGGGGPAERN